MVRNVKCQLVKSSKHKHENAVKLDRLSVCVHACVCACVRDCDLVSVGVVDVFRGQRWDHRRFSLTLDVHRQHHWLGREMNVLNGCTFPPPVSWLQQSLCIFWQLPSWREQRGGVFTIPASRSQPTGLQQVTISHLHKRRALIFSWTGDWSATRVMEVGSNRSEDPAMPSNTQRSFKLNDYLCFKNIWISTVGFSPRRCWRWHWQWPVWLCR